MSKEIDKLELEIQQKDIMIEALKNAIGNILQGKKWCKEIKGGKTLYIDLHENCISKDKIKDILLKFQNKYDGYLETTDKLFIGKEVLQYGEDMLDEIAKELDIKLLEE